MLIHLLEQSYLNNFNELTACAQCKLVGRRDNITRPQFHWDHFNVTETNNQRLMKKGSFDEHNAPR